MRFPEDWTPDTASPRPRLVLVADSNHIEGWQTNLAANYLPNNIRHRAMLLACMTHVIWERSDGDMTTAAFNRAASWPGGIQLRDFVHAILNHVDPRYRWLLDLRKLGNGHYLVNTLHFEAVLPREATSYRNAFKALIDNIQVHEPEALDAVVLRQAARTVERNGGAPLPFLLNCGFIPKGFLDKATETQQQQITAAANHPSIMLDLLKSVLFHVQPEHPLPGFQRLLDVVAEYRQARPRGYTGGRGQASARMTHTWHHDRRSGRLLLHVKGDFSGVRESPDGVRLVYSQGKTEGQALGPLRRVQWDAANHSATFTLTIEQTHEVGNRSQNWRLTAELLHKGLPVRSVATRHQIRGLSGNLLLFRATEHSTIGELLEPDPTDGLYHLGAEEHVILIPEGCQLRSSADGAPHNVVAKVPNLVVSPGNTFGGGVWGVKGNELWLRGPDPPATRVATLDQAPALRLVAEEPVALKCKGELRFVTAGESVVLRARPQAVQVTIAGGSVSQTVGASIEGTPLTHLQPGSVYQLTARLGDKDWRRSLLVLPSDLGQLGRVTPELEQQGWGLQLDRQTATDQWSNPGSSPGKLILPGQRDPILVQCPWTDRRWEWEVDHRFRGQGVPLENASREDFQRAKIHLWLDKEAELVCIDLRDNSHVRKLSVGEWAISALAEGMPRNMYLDDVLLCRQDVALAEKRAQPPELKFLQSQCIAASVGCLPLADGETPSVLTIDWGNAGAPRVSWFALVDEGGYWSLNRPIASGPSSWVLLVALTRGAIVPPDWHGLMVVAKHARRLWPTTPEDGARLAVPHAPSGADGESLRTLADAIAVLADCGLLPSERCSAFRWELLRRANMCAEIRQRELGRLLQTISAEQIDKAFDECLNPASIPARSWKERLEQALNAGTPAAELWEAWPAAPALALVAAGYPLRRGNDLGPLQLLLNGMTPHLQQQHFPLLFPEGAQLCLEGDVSPLDGTRKWLAVQAAPDAASGHIHFAGGHIGEIVRNGNGYLSVRRGQDAPRAIADVKIPDGTAWLGVLNPSIGGVNNGAAGAVALLTKRGYRRALLEVREASSLAAGDADREISERFTQMVRNINWRWPSLGQTHRQAILGVANYRPIVAAQQVWRIAWLARVASRDRTIADWVDLYSLSTEAFKVCPRLFAADLTAAELILHHHTQGA